MARIRSIHPGLMTDEAFMAIGHGAFRFYTGLLMEADDQGIFEWKPLTLKARILPAHNEDVIGLLAELTVANIIIQFTANGRAYGAIRNFMKWQRPRRPSNVHPMTPEIAVFVSRSSEQTANIPDSGRTANDTDDDVPANVGSPPDKDGRVPAEVGGRREDGGGKRESNKYAFAGVVIRLNRADYDRWRKTYSMILDFDAELHRIDDALQAKPPDNWFSAASAMLAAKHQKLLGAQRAPPVQPTRRTPLGVGG
jgi:hypothetical protein